MVKTVTLSQMGDLMKRAKLGGFLPSFYLKWLNVSDEMMQVKLKYLDSYSLEPVLAWSERVLGERPAARRVLMDLQIARKRA